MSTLDLETTHRVHYSSPQIADIAQPAVSALPSWKRATDVVFSIIVLLVLSPLLVAVAVAIKITSTGPIIFKQQRVGLAGKPFTCYKFRSMVLGAETQRDQLLEHNLRSGVGFKMINDPRVTPVGRIVRRTSIDELPQLFNVLKRDMSLVGPRPLPVEDARQQDAWHTSRQEIVPGITCLWQVYARHSHCHKKWARYDMDYIQNRSPLLDLKILLLTLPAVISTRGAH